MWACLGVGISGVLLFGVETLSDKLNREFPQPLSRSMLAVASVVRPVFGPWSGSGEKYIHPVLKQRRHLPRQSRPNVVAQTLELETLVSTLELLRVW